jgi:hypothetical protein
MDRRHQPALDPGSLVQDLREGREAVGRAGGVGDDVVAVGVVGVVEVDAERDRDVRLLRRRRDDHLLGARLEVLRGVVTPGEPARRLDHDVDAQVGPWEACRVALREHPHLGAVDEDRAIPLLDLAWEAPVHRVVLEQVGERVHVRDVVQRNELDLGVVLVGGAEDVAPDAPEPVDPDLHSCHLRGPPR